MVRKLLILVFMIAIVGSISAEAATVTCSYDFGTKELQVTNVQTITFHKKIGMQTLHIENINQPSEVDDYLTVNRR